MRTHPHIFLLYAVVTPFLAFSTPFCEAPNLTDARGANAEHKAPTTQNDLNLLRAPHKADLKHGLGSEKGLPQATGHSVAGASSALGFQPTHKQVAGTLGADAIRAEQQTVGKVMFMDRYSAGLKYDYSEVPVIAEVERTKGVVKVPEPEVSAARQKLETLHAHGTYLTRDEEEAGKWYQRAAAQKRSTSYDSVWSRDPDGQYRYLTKDQETVEKWFAPAGGRDIFLRGRFLESPTYSAGRGLFGQEFGPMPRAYR